MSKLIKLRQYVSLEEAADDISRKATEKLPVEALFNLAANGYINITFMFNKPTFAMEYREVNKNKLDYLPLSPKYRIQSVNIESTPTIDEVVTRQLESIIRSQYESAVQYMIDENMAPIDIKDPVEKWFEECFLIEYAHYQKVLIEQIKNTAQASNPLPWLDTWKSLSTETMITFFKGESSDQLGLLDATSLQLAPNLFGQCWPSKETGLELSNPNVTLLEHTFFLEEPSPLKDFYIVLERDRIPMSLAFKLGSTLFLRDCDSVETIYEVRLKQLDFESHRTSDGSLDMEYYYQLKDGELRKEPNESHTSFVTRALRYITGLDMTPVIRTEDLVRFTSQLTDNTNNAPNQKDTDQRLLGNLYSMTYLLSKLLIESPPSHLTNSSKYKAKFNHASATNASKTIAVIASAKLAPPVKATTLTKYLEEGESHYSEQQTSQ